MEQIWLKNQFGHFEMNVDISDECCKFGFFIFGQKKKHVQYLSSNQLKSALVGYQPKHAQQDQGIDNPGKEN